MNSNMDEISFWVFTKRAPCLFNYDNLIKNELNRAHNSKAKPKSVCSTPQELPSPVKVTPNKKKRKLPLLDDDSVSTRKPQNIYFKTTQQNVRTMVSCKSDDTLGSDIEFNIKKSSPQKPKRMKLNKKNSGILHKKTKLITSTPRVAGSLRRSSRKRQTSANYSNHLNGTQELDEAIADLVTPPRQKKIIIKTRKSDKIAFTQTENKVQNKETRRNVLFEDLSDVSGFTANYIKSTKLGNKNTKTPRQKVGRNLVKETHQNCTIVSSSAVHVNKSVNTGLPSTMVLNNSTDSSQNIMNYVSMETTDKLPKVSRSTSLLKFMEAKSHDKSKESLSKRGKLNNLNNSVLGNNLLSECSTSRYPKRNKASFPDVTGNGDSGIQPHKNPNKKNESNSSKFNCEKNPNVLVSRTRSGRNICVSLRAPENSVVVISESTEQVSSLATCNVAEANHSNVQKKKRMSSRQTDQGKRSSELSLKKHDVQSQSRDKSGFAACFSDSDEDSEAMKQRKFFC